jgi:hypothetical protein
LQQLQAQYKEYNQAVKKIDTVLNSEVDSDQKEKSMKKQLAIIDIANYNIDQILEYMGFDQKVG